MPYLQAGPSCTLFISKFRVRVFLKIFFECECALFITDFFHNITNIVEIVRDKHSDKNLDL